MQHATTTVRAGGRCVFRASKPIVVAGALAFGSPAGAHAQDVADGTLAAGIRANGLPCERVLDKARTSESPTVYRVRCNSGRFEVTMDGDNVAKVVSID